jgi:hypothetical protein
MGWKVSLRIRCNRRASLPALLAVAALVLVFLGYLVWGQVRAVAGPQAPNAVQASQAAQAVTTGMRQYYLTNNSSYLGSQPKDACASGYHMASLWEILDPSNLRYNVNLGYDREDVGMGPPSATFGWIRTGYESDDGSINGAGHANCSVWDSSSSGHYGTVVRLPSDWANTAQQDISVWDVALRECSQAAPAWCVADLVGSGVCADPLYISDGQRVDGDTALYTNNIDSYSCAYWDESGPETLYGFTLPAGDFYTVTAEISGMTADLDVFLLSSTGCGDPGQCLTTTSSGDYMAEAAPVAPGTYYVAVDGFMGVSDIYSVELTVQSGAGEKVYIPLVQRDYQ